MDPPCKLNCYLIRLVKYLILGKPEMPGIWGRWTWAQGVRGGG